MSLQPQLNRRHHQSGFGLKMGHCTRFNETKVKPAVYVKELRKPDAEPIHMLSQLTLMYHSCNAIDEEVLSKMLFLCSSMLQIVKGTEVIIAVL